MRHEVEDGVDAERISDALGIRAEVKLVFAFAFPAVADVAVVDGQDHHPLAVVEQSAHAHFLRALTAENGLQWRLRVPFIVVAVPELDGGDLEAVHRAPQIVNAVEYRVVRGQLSP